MLLIIVIVSLGLVPLLWFKGDLIAGGDILWLLDSGRSAETYRYAWAERITGGSANLTSAYPIPIAYLDSFLKWLGFSAVAAEQAYFVLYFMAAGLSMWYLVSVISKGRGAEVWKLSSSLLYMFNPFMIVNNPLNTNFFTVYAVTPLMLALWIKGLDGEKGQTRYAMLIGLLSLAYTTANINPPAVSTIPILLFAYLLYHLLMNRGSTIASLKFAASTCLIYVLVNIWWMVTYFPEAIGSNPQIEQAYVGNELFFTLGATKLLEALRFMGSWGWRTVHYQMPYFPFYPTYDTPFFLVITYAVPILAFSSLLLTRRWEGKQQRMILFFALMAVVGLFLTKGTTPPFGFLYEWAWRHVPGFWTFREPFSKFTPLTLLSMSILFSASVNAIYNKIADYGKAKGSRWIRLASASIPALVGGMILLIGFPLLNGEVIWDYWNGSMRSWHVDIPDYWREARAWLSQEDRESRILLLPKAQMYGHVYNWKSGAMFGAPVALVLLDNPLIYFDSGPIRNAEHMANKIYDILQPGNQSDATPLLRLLNVRYVLQQNDLAWDFAGEGSLPPDQMKQILDNQQNISFEKTLGMLDFYTVDDYLPHIYASTTPAIVEGGLYALTSPANASHLEGNPAVFLTDQLDAGTMQSLTEKIALSASTRDITPATLTFHKINPTRYRVQVKDAKDPYFLVFSESFHQGWKAYIEPGQNGGSRFEWSTLLSWLLKGRHRTELPDHFLVNGYANSWYVDKEGSYDIVLEYQPQRLFEMGIIISASTFIACLGYLIWDWRKGQRTKRPQLPTI